MMGDELYAAYLAGGPTVLAEAFPTPVRFETFRSDFRTRVLTRWETLERVPAQAMFMFDIAVAVQSRRFIMWADFLLLGQTYLRQRPELPGANPRFDAFELLWNKTVIAFLAGRRQPELVDELVRRLPQRIVATPPADGLPALVDPWIEFTRGFVEEGYIIQDVTRVDARGPAAVAHYREAAKYESTRAEATVRLANLQRVWNRPASALEALDSLDERWTREGVVLYWALLIRGKVLDALDRPDDAMAAYRRALEIAPSSQAPHIGEMMVEARRGQGEAAERIALAIRVQPDPVIDPWGLYPHGDRRFYQDRLKALREMVAK
jgi:tetratricopeptide (TPR) repeat protein